MFDDFAEDKTVVVTTYRRNGTPVETPMHIAVDHGDAFIRTYGTALKWKRLRRNAELLVSHANTSRRPALLGLFAPKKTRPVGRPVHARAVVLEGAESERAALALARKYPFLQGFLIPLMHRFVLRTRTLHMRLIPQ